MTTKALRLILLLACATSVFAQSPSGDELISNAQRASNLRNSDAAPFKYEANVKITKGKRTSEGYYSVQWVSPARWRDSVSVAGASQTRIADGKLVASSPIKRMDLFEVRGAVHRLFPENIMKLSNGETITKVKDEKIASVPLRCVTISSKTSTRELCFDPKTGLLTVARWAASVTAYSDYVNFNGRWVPRHIRTGMKDGETVEATVEQLGQSQAEIDFAVPAAAKSVIGCEFPLLPHITQVREPLMSRDPLQNFPNVYKNSSAIITVGADAKPRELVITESGGVKADQWLQDLASASRYEPARCDGEAVEGQTAFAIGTR